MNLLMPLIIGGLFTAGIYLMLRRSIVKLIIGLALLSHAANLVIFASAGLVRAKPPLIDVETQLAPVGVADPVPQALVLTAIVISFAVLAFTLVLIHRAHETIGTDDLDRMKTKEM
jgi:multicomponent Na+:H+ antiporter subunit C